MKPFIPLACVLVLHPGSAMPDQEKNIGLQPAENPPMQTIYREPPPPPRPSQTFEVREGYTLIQTLRAFRTAIKQSGQKVRMKPGVYRVQSTDPPVEGHQHVFAVTGSDNHFDLRGVVFEIPVSVTSTLSRKPHVSDTWHIFGDNNTFEGGYFLDVLDRPYPRYSVTENEFEVLGDGNTFADGIFVLQGSIPYGYSDYYGKGGPNFGRLNKHSFMSIAGAHNTHLLRCAVYMRSFGHGIHFHGANGVRIENCLFSGTLRPTNDVFREKVGRAVEYDFHIMYRGRRPIPHDQMIPLTEDGVRTYGGDRNITVVNTTVERFRGCFQVLCHGNVTLDNVTVREAGDFCFDLSAGDEGKVVMRNCRADVAYSPVFNLTRGALPHGASYEVTILNPQPGVSLTSRASLGTICGEGCTFILHDGTTRSLPPAANRLVCGGKKPLTDSLVVNYTTAKLILEKNVRNCTIRTAGPVEDRGVNNRIFRIARKRTPPISAQDDAPGTQ